MDHHVRLCQAEPRDLHHIERWFEDADLRSKMMGTKEADALPAASVRSEMYMILANVDDSRIGYIELADINHARGRAEIKMCIGSSGDRGRGYGQQALQLVIANLLERGFRSIYLRVMTDNEPAVRCYEKVGFIKTGLLRGHRLGDGAMFLMEYPG